MLPFWTSCVLPHGFQIRRGSLACTHSCLRAVISKVTSGVTPAFSTNRGEHCISVYTAWQLSHFDPHTCCRQMYPQALVASRSEPGLEPMALAGARTHDLPCHSTAFYRSTIFGVELFSRVCMFSVLLFYSRSDSGNQTRIGT